MNSRVSHERSLLEELLATDGTSVGQTAVDSAVVHQLELPGERGSTVLAHEGVQRSVEARVHHQVILLGETLATVLAHVGTFACMVFTVSDQVTLQRKGSAAFLADERSLATMDP